MCINCWFFSVLCNVSYLVCMACSLDKNGASYLPGSAQICCFFHPGRGCECRVGEYGAVRWLETCECRMDVYGTVRFLEISGGWIWWGRLGDRQSLRGPIFFCFCNVKCHSKAERRTFFHVLCSLFHSRGIQACRSARD